MTGQSERPPGGDDHRIGEDWQEAGERRPSGDLPGWGSTGGGDGWEATDDHLSLDTIHGLLAARRRRYTLYCLYLYPTPMRLGDVAEQVAEWTHGTRDGERSDRCRRTYVGLSHVHVPKLSDAGVVTYSRRGDTVELAPNASELRPYLERASEADLAGTDAASL